MWGVFPVVFTARQKWVDFLLASMPKSVRLLLTADAGRLVVAAEIQYGPNMSGTSLPWRSRRISGTAAATFDLFSAPWLPRIVENVEAENYATISGFENLITFET